MATFGEDFGQKIDLCARLREVLRNYPEGVSVVSELVQNADDAGARSFVLTLDERVHPTETCVEGLRSLQGVSVLAYNDSIFQESDFASIQRLGDSLKREEKEDGVAKIGRFGIGFNAVYHLTEMPSFASGKKLVYFDPQAKYLPNVDPTNPGKMIDIHRDQELLETMRDQFCGYRDIMGWNGKDFFDGTLFRLPLRTEDQAKDSRLSTKAYSIQAARQLLADAALASSRMLIFLKNIESITLQQWQSGAPRPIIISAVNIRNCDHSIRTARAAVSLARPMLIKSPAIEKVIDYELIITSRRSMNLFAKEVKNVDFSSDAKQEDEERWLVCNQLGGGRASIIANDTIGKRLGLLPWAGVALRLDSKDLALKERGRAFCFLPLPIKTGLAFEVNGYFELSSNRRDVWQQSQDHELAGDGGIRAEWNIALVRDVASKCVLRCLATCTKVWGPSLEYYALFPDPSKMYGSDQYSPWRVMATSILSGIAKSKYPLLWCSSKEKWLQPREATLLHPEAPQGLASALSIISDEPIVCENASALSQVLYNHRVVSNIADAVYAAKVLRGRPPNAELSVQDAVAVLRYVSTKSLDLIDGLPILPLATMKKNKRHFGIILRAPLDTQAVTTLVSIGFSTVQARAALAATKQNADAALTLLTEDGTGQSLIPFYYLCEDDESIQIFDSPSNNAPSGVVAVSALTKSRDDPLLAELRRAHNLYNIVAGTADLVLPDLLNRALPSAWKDGSFQPWQHNTSTGNTSLYFTSDGSPRLAWFNKLWKFIASANNVKDVVRRLADGKPILPLSNGLTAPLSRTSAIIYCGDALDAPRDALAPLGVFFLHDDFQLDRDLRKIVTNYLFSTTKVDVLLAIDAGIRRLKLRELPWQHNSDRDAVRRWLSSLPGDELLNDHERSIASKLQIWPTLTDADTYVALDSSIFVPDRDWYPQKIERAAANKINVILADGMTVAEEDFAIACGAQIMERSEFVLSVLGVKPDFDFVSLVLKDAPLLIADDERPRKSSKKNRLRFRDAAACISFVPTGDPSSVAKPSDLYDPTAAIGAVLISTILPVSAFPSDELAGADILQGLRLLGLQSKLDWETVVKAALSIEKSQDAIRGMALLQFMDGEASRLLSLTDDEAVRQSSDANKASSWFDRVLLRKSDQNNTDAKKVAARKEQALRHERLRTIAWIPTSTGRTVKPMSARSGRDAWCCSKSLSICEYEPRSPVLLNCLAWDKPVPLRLIATQLAIIAADFTSDRNENIVGLVHRLYSALDTALRTTGRQQDTARFDVLSENESKDEEDAVTAINRGLRVRSQNPSCVWVGSGFATADCTALHGTDEAAPYLHVVPTDVQVYSSLLRVFGVVQTFTYADYVGVLRVLLKEQPATDAEVRNEDPSITKRRSQIALAMVRCLGNNESLTTERCADLDVLLLDENNLVGSASSLVIDDAPWLREEADVDITRVVASMRIVHPQIASKVAQKLGAQSMRRALLQVGDKKMKGASSDKLFADDVEFSAFGQHEPIYTRIRNILTMYPDASVLSELIQNADDAGAHKVSIILDLREHGKKSLLAPSMGDWQGPCLWIYNDAMFTDNDWKNIVRVGQGSKLQKVSKTGRFGIGFCSCYHFTDIPQILSGDYLLLLDPHATIVPGALPASPGLRVKFVNAHLPKAFPDQFSPFEAVGCELGDLPFQGTMIRLPLRPSAAADRSEISRRTYGVDTAMNILSHFKTVADDILLFLRNISAIDVHVLDDAVGFRHQYSVSACERPLGTQGLWKNDDVLVSIFKSTQRRRPDPFKDDVRSFLGDDGFRESSTATFFSRLSATPSDRLPRSFHETQIVFTETGTGKEVRKCLYYVASVLGGGEAKAIASDPENREFKFIPFAQVAALIHSSSDGDFPAVDGRVFCFLPLPARSGLPVAINGYFELSSSRQDIYYGEDAAAGRQGQIRSEWNEALLRHSVACAYSEVLLAVMKAKKLSIPPPMLWPVETLHRPWTATQESLFKFAKRLALVEGTTGIKLAPEKSISYDPTDLKAAAIVELLLKEALPIVCIKDEKLRSALKRHDCFGAFVSPKFVRSFYIRYGPTVKDTKRRRASLTEPNDIALLLEYALDDLSDNDLDSALSDVPLLLTQSGSLGAFAQAQEDESNLVLVADCEARSILSIVNSSCLPHDAIAESVVRIAKAQGKTRLQLCRPEHISAALSKRFPSEWSRIDLVIASQDLMPLISSVWCWYTRDDISSDIYEQLPLLPVLLGPQRRNALTRMTISEILPPIISPVPISTNFIATNDLLGPRCADALLSAGVCLLDTNTLKHGQSRSNIGSVAARQLAARAYQPTLIGVARALNKAIDPDSRICWEEGPDAVAQHCAALRDFFAVSTLSEEVKSLLRRLRIFAVFQSDHFASVDQGGILPPDHCDESLLYLAAQAGSAGPILNAKDQASRSLLEVLGAQRLEHDDLVLAALPQFAQGQNEELRRKASGAVLRELPYLCKDKDVNLEALETIAQTPFVPIRGGGSLSKPMELYDPTVGIFTEILDESNFPEESIGEEQFLALRRLGLRTKLDSDAIIASVGSVHALVQSAELQNDEEVQARTVSVALKRARALLRELDRVDDLFVLCSGDVIEELRALRWIPTMEVPQDSLLPRMQRDQDIPIASPHSCRPVADSWLCSSVLYLVARSDEPRSHNLLTLLGWDEDIDPQVIARQLIALGLSFNDRLSAAAADSIRNENHDHNEQTVRVANEDDDSIQSADELEGSSGYDSGVDQENAFVSFCRALSSAVPRMYDILSKAARDEAFEQVRQLLLSDDNYGWIYLGLGGMSPSRFVAMRAPEFRAAGRDDVISAGLFLRKRPLYECPESLAATYDELLSALGVRDEFDALDYVEALKRINKRVGRTPLDKDDLELVKTLISMIADSSADPSKEYVVLVPDEESFLVTADILVYDDAAWLSSSIKASLRAKSRGGLRICHPSIDESSARKVGVKSLRELLLSSNNESTQSIPCPTVVPEIDGNQAIMDMLALGSSIAAQSITCIIDSRIHQASSLLNPSLAAAQGPALVIYYETATREAIRTDDIVRLLSVEGAKQKPSKPLKSSTNALNGKSVGPPVANTSLASAFALSEMVIVLSSDQLHFFDPSNLFFPTNENDEKNSLRGRRYSLENGKLSKRFPDQWTPFEATPFGVSERNGCQTGMLVRLPLKQEYLTDDRSAIDSSKIKNLISALEKNAYHNLIFSETLESIAVHRFTTSALLPLLSCVRAEKQVIEVTSTDSNKANGRSIRQSLANTVKAWQMSKMQQFFSTTWSPPRVIHEFEIIQANFGEPASNRVDKWIISSILAPTKRVRELSDDAIVGDYAGRMANAPLVSVAACINSVAGGKLFCAGVATAIDVSGVASRLYIDAPFAIDSQGLLYPPVRPVRPTRAAQHQADAIDAVPVAQAVDDAQEEAEVADVVSIDPLSSQSLPDISLSEKSYMLGEWNVALWNAAFQEVIPSLLLQLRDQLSPRYTLYQYWPRLATYTTEDSAISCHLPGSARGAAARLCAQALFLSPKGDSFMSSISGIFRASPVPVLVEAFLLKRCPIFQVPSAVGVDIAAALVNVTIEDSATLNSEALSGAFSGRNSTITLATSKLLRQVLSKERSLAREILEGGGVRLACHLFRLCVADAVHAADDDSAAARRLRQRTWSEIRALPLLSLSNNTLTTPKRGIFLCTDLQRRLVTHGNAGIPLVHKEASRLVPELFDLESNRSADLRLEFATAVSLERFNAATLASHISKLVPSEWQNARIVDWDAFGAQPSVAFNALWLRDFWAEISIMDPGAVGLFDGWPLIPVKGHRLIDCRDRDKVLVPPLSLKSADDSIDTYLKNADARRMARLAADERANQEASRAADQLDRQRYAQMGEALRENASAEEKIENAEAARTVQLESSSVYYATLGRDRRLLDLCDKIGVPILEVAWFNADSRNDVIDGLVGSGGGVVVHALFCLSSICEDSRARAAFALKWNALDNGEREFLLEVFLGSVTQQSQREKIRRLPFFKTVSGEFTDLVVYNDASNTQRNFAVLGINVEETIRKFVPENEPLSQVESSNLVVLKTPRLAAARDLLLDFQIEVLDEAGTIASLLIPRFTEIFDNSDSGSSRLKLFLAWLVNRWETLYSRSNKLKEALTQTAFVPSGREYNGTEFDSNNASIVFAGKMILARPDALLDPSIESLAVACGLNDNMTSSESLFPLLEYRSEKWLKMLRDLGLKRALDTDTFIRSAKRAAERKDVDRSRQLMRHLFTDDFSQQASQRVLTSNAEFMRTIGTISFVPARMMANASEVVFTSFQQVAVEADRAVCWTSTPIIDATDEPPRILFSALGIQSPPEISRSLAHIGNLARSRKDFEDAFQSVNVCGISVIQAFDELFNRLTEAWTRLSPRVQQALPTMSIIPVSKSADSDDHFRNFVLLSPTSRRVFLEVLPEARTSLVYELPKGLSKHSTFLQNKLHIARSPGAKEYSDLLRELATSSARRLDPNELFAALKLCDLISGAQQKNEAQNRTFVPDESGKLRAASEVIYDDDPVLRRFIESSDKRLVAAHPRLTKASCTALSVPMLSQTARIELINADNDITFAPDTELKATLVSSAFIRALVDLCEEHFAYDRSDFDEIETRNGTQFESALRLLNVVKSSLIQTKVILPGRYIEHYDSNQNFESTPSTRFAFLDKDTSLFVHRRELSNEEHRQFYLEVALSIRSYLNLPRSITYGIATVLSNGLVSYQSQGHQRHRVLALQRGVPGSVVDADDAARLRIALTVHRFTIGEVVAVLDNNGVRRYAKILEIPTHDASVVPQLVLDTGGGREILLSTEIYIFTANMDDSASRIEENAQPAPSSEGGWCEEKGDLGSTSTTGNESRGELLTAVDDLLRRAALPPLETDRRSLLEHLAESKAKIIELESAQPKSSNPKEPPPELICPITLSVMTDPVVCADGNSYERSAIERWLATRGTSPLTNARLATRTLFPNRALQRALARFRGEDEEVAH